MPGKNGMGPNGLGPMTGRAAGYCARNHNLGQFGFQGRRRNCFCQNNIPGWRWANQNIPPNVEYEKNYLTIQAQEIEKQLSQIKNRLSEIESAEKQK